MLEATGHPSGLPLQGIRETGLFSWPRRGAGQILGVRSAFNAQSFVDPPQYVPMLTHFRRFKAVIRELDTKKHLMYFLFTLTKSLVNHLYEPAFIITLISSDCR